jgi:dipeptidyl aminopeptidase/acylaminoacyl peptidase
MEPGVSAPAVARTKVVGEPRIAPDGGHVGWLESTDGHTALVVAPADGSGPPVNVTGDLTLGGVGAYRGGAWCWVDDARVAVVARDGSLVVAPVAGGPTTVVAREGRAAAPVAAPDGRILFACERDDTLDVAETWADGRAWPQRWSFADCAWDPTISADGRWIAWHEWDLAAMSWTASRIVLVDRHVGSPLVVAGGSGVSVGQPRFSPDGRMLAYVSDETGWWNVHVAAADGSGARPLVVEPHDHAEPAWGPGQRSFAWSPTSDAIALCRNEGGFARLVVVGLDAAPAAGVQITEVARGWHHGIDWGAPGIVAVRSGARTPPQVALADPAGNARRVLARGAPAGLELGAREPEVVTWSSGDHIISGLLYRPDADGAGSGADGSGPPPLLVDLHGGPTGQAVVRWDGWLRYFTSRGFAVLRPNPRGSTGSGRAFVQDFARTWGDADVADVAAGIEAAGRAGWGDPSRVAVAGGSAGGLTALLVCARHGHLVRAAVSAYGVTDLFDLARTTHRFESRYLDEVIGRLPADAATYRDRSPVTHASAIRVPLLVLQGDADVVVPPAQAQLLVDAVRAAGGTVEHHVYAGEGHGWSRAETVQDELERTWAFLERWVVNA